MPAPVAGIFMRVVTNGQLYGGPLFIFFECPLAIIFELVFTP